MKRILLPTTLIIILITVLFLMFGHWENWFEFQFNAQRENLWIFSLVSYLVLSSDILLPVPSSILMFVNGAVLGIFLGALLSLISALTSSLIGYFIGKRLTKFTNRFFQSKETNTAKKLLHQYGWVAIIISRGLPILAETIAIMAGNLKYKFRTFFWSNLIGYIPVCMVYAVAGYYSFETQSLLIAFGINILIAAVFWLADRRLSMQRTV